LYESQPTPFRRHQPLNPLGNTQDFPQAPNCSPKGYRYLWPYVHFHNTRPAGLLCSSWTDALGQSRLATSRLAYLFVALIDELFCLYLIRTIIDSCYVCKPVRFPTSSLGAIRLTRPRIVSTCATVTTLPQVLSRLPGLHSRHARIIAVIGQAVPSQSQFQDFVYLRRTMFSSVIGEAGFAAAAGLRQFLPNV
jgi:hypothetical protein